MNPDLGKYSPTDRPDFARHGRPSFVPQQDPQAPRAKVVKATRIRQALLAEAADLLPHLPAEGESVHCIMAGRYSLSHLLVVIVGRLGVCEDMRVSTLAFSDKNVHELAGLLSEDKVKRLTLLCSKYFHDNSKHTWDLAVKELVGRGARLAAARTHCKVVTMAFADGTALSVEGSANLRSNSNWEQVAVTNGRELLLWHGEWIDGLVEQWEAGRKRGGG